MGRPVTGRDRAREARTAKGPDGTKDRDEPKRRDGPTRPDGAERSAGAGRTAGNLATEQASGTAGIGLTGGGGAAQPWIAPALTRIGILGGTFDPIHYGHLAIAEEVAEALDLERILFVPAAQPPHKLDDEVSPAEDRAEMIRLAIADNPKFALSRIELERHGPSYTSDTLEQLADEAARQRVARSLYFILSADAFAGFRGWHEPERVLARATLVIVPRPGSPLPNLEWIAEQLPPNPDAAPEVLFVDTVSLATSSTRIRERLAASRSIRYLVPQTVERYIRDHRLYRSTKPVRIA